MPLVQGLLFGLKAAVLAVVLEALIKVSKRALKGWPMIALAVAAFVAIAFLKLPFPLIVIGAALCGVVAASCEPRRPGNATPDAKPERSAAAPEWTQPSARRFVSTVAVWSAIWFLPLAALHLALGGGHVFSAEALFFSKMAAVTFGGAYAVLSYVAQQAVEVHHWLQPDEMLAGLGLAETTPGPLILVLVFVGFLGGARHAGLDPLTGGMAGALVTLWFTFVPCFLWIFAGAPYVETVRSVRWLATRAGGGHGGGGRHHRQPRAVVRPARPVRQRSATRQSDRCRCLSRTFATFDLAAAVDRRRRRRGADPLQGEHVRSARRRDGGRRFRSRLSGDADALPKADAADRFVRVWLRTRHAVAPADCRLDFVSRTGWTPIPRSPCARSLRRSGRQSK